MPRSRAIEATLALMLAACGGAAEGAFAPVEAVIAAARDDDASGLSELCDPEGRADSDARRLCAEDPARAREWALFRAWFKEARILGLVADRGGQSEAEEMRIAVAIGPDRRHVEVTVVRRGQRWYLLRL